MKELAGKTAFVTGAASGIGLGIATALAQAGAKVMLCDYRGGGACRAAVAELKKTNADVDSVRADVSLKTELQAAAEATTARYGNVHILVNNAGVGGGGPYGIVDRPGWNWTTRRQPDGGDLGDRDLWSADREARRGRAHRLDRLDRRADIGGSNSYNVSKYGVVAMSEGLRIELGPRGIGVSVLCPGFIRTQILNSRRNLPERFAGAFRGAAARPAAYAALRERVARAASIPPMSASWCARASRTTGPTSSPTTSSSRSSRCASPASRRALIASANASRSVEGATHLYGRCARR